MRRTLAFAAAVVLLLAACGDGGGEGTSDTTGAPSTVEETTTTAEPTTTTTASPEKAFCTVWGEFATFVAREIQTPASAPSAKATFEELSAELVDLAPDEDYHARAQELVDATRPVFDGRLPTDEEARVSNFNIPIMQGLCG